MITLRQLRYFEALARHLHFGRAAEECGISQPALSQQIQEMEAMLVLPLVERGARRLALTPKGEEIARRATRILGDVRDLTDFASHGGGVLSGTLKLGVIPSVAPYVLPKVLPLVHEAYPGLELHLRETRTDQLRQELAQGRLDVLLMALPSGDPSLESRPLFVDRFLLARRAGGDADTAAPASPDAIPPDRLLLLEEGHCLRDQALTYCRIQKSELQASFGSASLATIMQMVANGYGVTLLPEICVDVEAKDTRIALSRFADPEPQREIGLVWRRSSPRRVDFEALGDLVIEAMRAGTVPA
ncbi:LysR family transcriptional regulator, hydrogen peroxide-inducible genes activator [Kaistia soli DSM 19436]|uniref:LysR family transcriptional regulator, hydrogen peroxide-inducible genes activator n=1 Tax=Kaistia soli DSM 19436 TaxID=1122133 RepID=A0A1M4ZT48_9HYPH|nr:hydrogen peroxide-inducible genes activator [Kaistia soli]SHF21250.1 LysR family transcriptional regulator, hydrogen peroxide-inducible genes activator [Kaistia soli DSM 19436]